MDAQEDGDASGGAANPKAEDVEGLAPSVRDGDGGQEEEQSLNKDGDLGGGDEGGSDGEDQDANDANIEQAGQLLPNEDQPEDGGELVDNAADSNPGDDAPKFLQDEMNELKIELLSSHRQLDEAQERELELQRQLDELSKQRSAEARVSADKISRLENRVEDLKRQLEDASRQQQPSPSSDLRIRAAEVQELKARIKQYEIKLASSEEISNIRKEAEMERVRTDASWQHRMLSDQVICSQLIFRVIHVSHVRFNSRYRVLLPASLKRSRRISIFRLRFSKQLGSV